MKSALRSDLAPLSALGSTIMIVLARRLRLRMPATRRRHHKHRRRQNYSTFMMEQMSARSIF